MFKIRIAAETALESVFENTRKVQDLRQRNVRFQEKCSKSRESAGEIQGDVFESTQKVQNPGQRVLFFRGSVQKLHRKCSKLRIRIPEQRFVYIRSRSEAADGSDPLPSIKSREDVVTKTAIK